MHLCLSSPLYVTYVVFIPRLAALRSTDASKIFKLLFKLFGSNIVLNSMIMIQS